jgi:hypothetical protein
MGEKRAWVGWIVFAAVMLMVISMINIFQGIVGLIYDERLAISGGQLVVVDVTGWAWALLLSGVVMLLTGFGLLLGQTWARIVAIIVVGLHAVSQVMWLGAYPIWALLMIALDTTVLFALTARWTSSRLAEDFDAGPASSDARSRHAMPASGAPVT